MSISKSLSAAVVAVAIVSAVPMAQVAFAQPSPGATEQQRPQRPRASHIEGRLAFLKTELKITDAQTAQWNAFADVLRQQDKTRRERFEQMRGARGQETTALARYEQRERSSEAQAQDVKQFVATFRPLYQALSDEQKKTADELFARPHGHGMHRR
jgi:periplasmic protein CpxP/Spy